jgi:hypothetical protein
MAFESCYISDILPILENNGSDNFSSDRAVGQ